MKDYDHKEIESKWKKNWEEKELYKTPDSVKEKENEYILVEFPYPSGNLHVGHWYAFAVSDIYARFRKMQGKNVMFPIGFDAFGLPAENAAIKHNLNPREWTYKNIETMREQLKSMGAIFDWSREVITCDPDYYKWTQYLFLELFKAGLVEKKTTIVNWDPIDKTVLANEQVSADGIADRSGARVEKKEFEQWTVKITNYADKLIDDLEEVDFPEAIKIAQRNWIGRSEGAELSFKIKDSEKDIKIFTTRADTLYGVTYMVLAPEHKLVNELKEKIENFDEVEQYKRDTLQKSEIERTSEGKEKTGVELKGLKAINPVNNEEIPIFIADYVLIDYGTGAIMAVPAHDERDMEFAKKFGLPTKVVIENEKLINSEEMNGLIIKEAEKKITEKVNGELKNTYRLRDWIVSRQRYWGCPIPIINCSKCGSVPVSEKDLPVKLPEIEDYLPRDDGKSPLAKANDWKNVKCPKCGNQAERETDTLDTFVDSSWYFLRYTDAKNKDIFASKENLSKWMPVNFYSGGAEHTTMHLLYSRFFHKVLFDRGLVNEKEPYLCRLNRGIILGSNGEKMSKSKGNVIDPDKEVEKFGADTVRDYLAFIGPYNEVGSYPWDQNGIVGVRRFIERVADIENKIIDKTNDEMKKIIHQTIKKVGEDSQKLKFNTSISQLMVLTTKIQKFGIDKEDAKTVSKIIAPYAPFIAEELWHKLGGEGSVHEQTWPKFDEAKLVSDTMTIAVQINGKVRDQIEVSSDLSEDEIKISVLEREAVKKWLDGKEPKKVIYVKNKLISIVV